MKILAFDTTFKFCSVALMKNNKVFSLVNKGVSFQHSETIIPLIEKILSANLFVNEFEFLVSKYE